MAGCEPRVTPYGGSADQWLAVTPSGYPYRIGVVGKTPDQAREALHAALAAWEELNRRPLAVVSRDPLVAGM